MSLPRCHHPGFRRGTRRRVVSPLLALSYLATLWNQQQTLQVAAARLVMVYSGRADAAPLSVRTHPAPGSKPIAGIKGAPLRYFPHTCSVQQYLFRSVRGPANGLEFHWIDAADTAVRPSRPAKAAGGALPSGPLLPVLSLRRKSETSSVAHLPPSPAVTASAQGGGRGSAHEGKTTEERRAGTAYSKRLVAVFSSPAPALRPTRIVRPLSLCYPVAEAKKGTTAAPRSSEARRLAATDPRSQHANNADIVGARRTQLETRDSATAWQAKTQRPLGDSGPADETSAVNSGLMKTPISSHDTAAAGSAARRASGEPVLPEPVAREEGAYTTGPRRDLEPYDETANDLSGDFEFSSGAERRSLPQFSTSSSHTTSDKSSMLGATYSRGIVVLHAGGRTGGAEAALERHQRAVPHSTRWQAIARASEALEKLRRQAMQDDNKTAVRWLVPWAPEVTHPMWLGIPRLRAHVGGEGRGGIGEGLDGSKSAASKGTRAYAMNGTGAAAEDLDGLPSDDDDYVAAAAAVLFDNDELHAKEEEEEIFVDKTHKNAFSKKSALGLDSFYNLAKPATYRKAPVQMSGLQWSGGKPFPVFVRITKEGGSEEAAKRRRKKRKMRKKRRQRVHTDQVAHDEDVSADMLEGSGGKEVASRRLQYSAGDRAFAKAEEVSSTQDAPLGPQDRMGAQMATNEEEKRSSEAAGAAVITGGRGIFRDLRQESSKEAAYPRASSTARVAEEAATATGVEAARKTSLVRRTSTAVVPPAAGADESQIRQAWGRQADEKDEAVGRAPHGRNGGIYVEALGDSDEEAMLEDSFLKADDGDSKSAHQFGRFRLRGTTPHSSSAGARASGRPSRRLLANTLNRITGAAAPDEQQKQQHRANAGQDIQDTATASAPSVAGSVQTSAWSWKDLLFSRVSGQPTTPWYTDGNEEEGGCMWKISPHFDWTETPDSDSPGARHEQTRSDSDTKGTADPAAALQSAPKSSRSSEEEVWLFDECDDPEARRRIAVTAHIAGVRAIIFTDTSPSSEPFKALTARDNQPDENAASAVAVLSIPDIAETREMKRRLAKGERAQVTVNTVSEIESVTS